MVLLKMLTKIALPKMGELLVMMMTMISPSGREVPSAEKLRRRAKVLLPKFRLVVVEFRPERLLMIFFPRRKTSYSRRWPSESQQGAHEAGGVPPTLVGRWWPP